MPTFPLRKGFAIGVVDFFKDLPLGLLISLANTL
jgi:hypothetical protein